VSKHLTVTQTTELLDTLKATVREFAAAEEKLNREFKTKSDAAQKRFAEEIAALDAHASAQLQVAQMDYETGQTGLQSRYERRKARIGKLHKNAKRQRLQRVDDEEGRIKYQSQKGLLDTQRWRTESLARNDARITNFNQRLGEAQASLAALEEEAAKAFRGYGSFRKDLEKADSAAAVDVSLDEEQLLAALTETQSLARADLAKFNEVFLPKLFGAIPLGVGKSKAAPLAKKISDAIGSARSLSAAAAEKANAHYAAEVERIETESKQRTEDFQSHWRVGLEEAERAREIWPQHVDDKQARVTERLERLHIARLNRIETAHNDLVAKIQSETQTKRSELTSAQEARTSKFRADFDAGWQKLEADWRRQIEPLRAAIKSANAGASEFKPWTPELWREWTPPTQFGNAAKLGRIEVDLKRLAEAVPHDPRLAIAPQFSLPLVLTYPQQGSVLFETTRTGTEPVFDALNNIIFRLLATTPAGKLSFTIVDPVKLGQNFSAVMHLADYEDNVINGRIWTQPNQIEERLRELNEHMEKVIQMYLRNEYETIAEYNKQAGNIAEKYHFVVVADFPANFSETAMRRLLRIAASGARCGVYTLIHWDHRHTAPADFFPEELRKASVCINMAGEQFVLAHPLVTGAKVLPDAPPSPEFATEFLHKVGELGRGSNRVEVPFEQVAPPPNEVWSLETTEELRVPIGRSGATKLQYLAVGKGTRQHALVAGKTGSGKSTLFHVIITNLALWCSPEQVEFYLVDFKKGVEFKAYATHRLPHAKVVAIESDREFGLSVLQRLDEELKRRGELFRKLGVQDVAGYKRVGGAEPMPRTLLLIDEFQEFFVEDDRISQAANLLLDRIVRQGRAFGIHCILGSQTLGGAYTLARTTIGQMVIRIALQTNEADAYLIMDENNSAPRLLTRPGEGIYNDMAGASEGNSPFQAVWISDEARDAQLERVRRVADERGAKFTAPIVFEGNAPADVRDNPLLAQLLANKPAAAGPARIWLGAPNSIKGPTEVAFQNRSGNNLLVVGQREEAVLAMLGVSLIALAAQVRDAKLIVFESTAPGSSERAFVERVASSIPSGVTLAKPGDLAATLNSLAEDLQQRIDNEGAPGPAVFLFLHGLQNFKKLKQDDEFAFGASDDGPSPSAQLQKLITEGPAHGVHVIATLDTFNNVNRFLGRKLLSEFEFRVLFQMSANDSASLCDDPKASALGLHRALLYNEQEGYLETFRPYALPSEEWLHSAAASLAR
jgi:DNA segregation ATPase FtsK/SpoIIIE, S-DNA-T family